MRSLRLRWIAFEQLGQEKTFALCLAYFLAVHLQKLLELCSLTSRNDEVDVPMTVLRLAEGHLVAERTVPEALVMGLHNSLDKVICHLVDKLLLFNAFRFLLMLVFFVIELFHNWLLFHWGFEKRRRGSSLDPDRQELIQHHPGVISTAEYPMDVFVSYGSVPREHAATLRVPEA